MDFRISLQGVVLYVVTQPRIITIGLMKKSIGLTLYLFVKGVILGCITELSRNWRVLSDSKKASYLCT